MKFRTKSFLFVSVILISSSFLISLTGYLVTKNLIYQLFTDFILERNAATSEKVEQIIFERASDIKVLSLASAIQDWENDPITARQQLINIRNAYQAYSSLAIVDRNSIVRISTSNVGINEKFESLELLNLTKQSNDLSGICLNSTQSKKIRMLFAAPIGNSGYLVGSFPFIRLREKFHDFELPIADYVYPHYELRDSQGELLFASSTDKPTGSDLKKTNHKHKLEDEVWTSKDLLVVRNPIKFSSFLKNENWNLSATVSWEQVFAPIHKVLYAVVLSVACLLIILSFVIRRLVINSLRPLDRLVLALSKINEGVFEEIQEDRNRQDEFGNVIQGFNVMAKTLSTSIEEMNTASKFAALGVMSAGIAHEINNPLAIIDGNAARLQKAWQNKDEEKFMACLGKINKTVARIANIVKALKIYARNDESQPMTPQTVNSIMKDTMELCQEKFRNDGVKFEVKLGDSDLKINCISVQISQILLNLLNNAFDAISETNKDLEKWICIETLAGKDRVHIRVSNSGPKIPEDVVKNIFTPFFTTKEVGKGTGMGLSISMAIAEDHGGRIFVDMSSAHTVFVLDLPIFKSDSASQVA